MVVLLLQDVNVHFTYLNTLEKDYSQSSRMRKGWDGRKTARLLQRGQSRGGDTKGKISPIT